MNRDLEISRLQHLVDDRDAEIKRLKAELKFSNAAVGTLTKLRDQLIYDLMRVEFARARCPSS